MTSGGPTAGAIFVTGTVAIPILHHHRLISVPPQLGFAMGVGMLEVHPEFTTADSVGNIDVPPDVESQENLADFNGNPDRVSTANPLA